MSGVGILVLFTVRAKVMKTPQHYSILYHPYWPKCILCIFMLCVWRWSGGPWGIRFRIGTLLLWHVVKADYQGVLACICLKTVNRHIQQKLLLFIFHDSLGMVNFVPWMDLKFKATVIVILVIRAMPFGNTKFVSCLSKHALCAKTRQPLTRCCTVSLNSSFSMSVLSQWGAIWLLRALKVW